MRGFFNSLLAQRWADKSECALYERRALREQWSNSAKWARDLQAHRNNVTCCGRAH